VSGGAARGRCTRACWFASAWPCLAAVAWVVAGADHGCGQALPVVGTLVVVVDLRARTAASARSRRRRRGRGASLRVAPAAPQRAQRRTDCASMATVRTSGRPPISMLCWCTKCRTARGGGGARARRRHDTRQRLRAARSGRARTAPPAARRRAARAPMSDTACVSAAEPERQRKTLSASGVILSDVRLLMYVPARPSTHTRRPHRASDTRPRDGARQRRKRRARRRRGTRARLS
jgi:hypothetical protein